MRVNLIYSRSDYGNDRPHISKIKTEEYIYPVIMHVNTKDIPSNIYYSSINTNGHYNISKVILGCQHSGVFVDYHGEYAVSTNTFGIVDTQENLELIKNKLLDKEFRKLLEYCDYSSSGDVNYKILRLFRKDFYENN